MGSVRELSVSQLNSYIKSVFDDELILHNISVYGEIGQISVRDGVSYFSLAESNCNINCVIFSTLEKLEIGTKVLANGRVTFYSKSGRINFTVSFVKPIGRGEQYNEFMLLKERLLKEGLFENRPKPPVYISEIGVITSEAGAVIHDIMSVIRNKKVNVRVKMYPSAVQGDNAESSVIDALKKVNADNPDAVIIARGGGSNYDLDVFNSEKLARAVAESNVPVISAVGHETDYTLCDFCAGLRCGTPSIAAEAIADINLSFLARFYTALQKISLEVDRLYSCRVSEIYRAATSVIHSMDKKIDVDFQKIYSTIRRLFISVQTLRERDEKKLFSLSATLNGDIENVFREISARFKTATALLEAASPLKIISKGFAKVSVGGRDVLSVDDLKSNDRADLIFGDGRAEAIVTSVKKYTR